MPAAKLLHLRAFLEGVEVPVVAASVSAYTNAPASCSLQVIPLDSGMRLKPRTMVHVFYLDTQNVVTGANTDATKGKVTAGTITDIRGDYRLFFSGEVIGFAYQQTPMSRALILQCVDFSSYWDSAHVTAIEYGMGGNAFTHTGSLWASNLSLFDDIINQHPEKLVGWLKEKPQTPGLNTVSGLAGGIIRILEAMGGVPNVQKGVNDFFTIAQLRCRLLEQITAEENDNTAHRLLEVQVFDEWLRHGLQNMGQQVTFRDLMKLLFRYIYYEVVPNPLAMFVKDQKGTETKKEGRSYLIKESPTGLRAKAILSELELGLTTWIANGGASNNVADVAKGAVADLEEAKSGLKGLATSQPTTKTKVDAIVADVDKSIEAGNSLIKKLTSPSSAEQKEPTSKQGPALDQSPAPAPWSPGVLPAATPLSPTAAKSQEDIANEAKWGQLQSMLDAVTAAVKTLNEANVKIREPDTVVSTARTQQLHSQIIRPDCWFSAPPVCNVVFPEQYTQFAFERNYAGEATRTLMQLHNTLIDGAGQDRLMATKILSPFITQATKALASKTDDASYRILMEHELHTGIIAKEEWLPDTSAVSKDTSSTDKVKYKGMRLTWAKRVSLFHFFKYRFAARQISVGGRFNPNMVCGFPGVLIRAPYVIDMEKLVKANPSLADAKEKDLLTYIDEKSDQLNAPSHFLGMVASVSHNIDQSGGTTSFTMHHVREHIGTDDEFLKVSQGVEFKTAEKVVQVVLSYDAVKDLPEKAKLLCALTPQVEVHGPEVWRSPVTLKSLGRTEGERTTAEVNPESGLIEEKIEVVSTPTTSEESVEGESLPYATCKTTYDGREILAPNPAGLIGVGDQGFFPNGKIVAIELADPNVEMDFRYGQLYRKVILHEKIEVPLTGKMPVEEVIRPRGWFSPKYENTAIGEGIYRPFFGCGSVVDQLLVALGDTAIASQAPPDEEPTVDVATGDPVSFVAEVSKVESSRLSYTVEKALNTLSYIYGLVRSRNLDVDEFISSYTRRPVATLREVLGDPDLSLKVTGMKVEVDPGSKGKFVGFHTMSVNEQAIQAGGLVGLMDDPSTGLTRIDGNGETAQVLAHYDVRREKLAMVKKYVADLQRGPAFRG